MKTYTWWGNWEAERVGAVWALRRVFRGGERREVGRFPSLAAARRGAFAWESEQGAGPRL